MPEGVIPVDWREDQKPVYWSDYKDLAQQFGSAVESIKPDLIHAGPIQRVAYLPALIDFHPLLAMSWGFDLLEDARRDGTWKEITRFVLQNCDWFTSDCRTTKEIALNYGIPESRTTVFPWGVDHKIFNPDARGSMRRQVGYERFLIVTRAHGNRVMVLILQLKAFTKLSSLRQIFNYFCLGGGSQENLIRSFINDKGISERVQFFGYKENEALAGYYQAADVDFKRVSYRRIVSCFDGSHGMRLPGIGL